MNEKISEIVDFVRKNSSKPTKGYDLGNRKFYRIQDGIYTERSTLEAIPVEPFITKLILHEILRCLENCNPDKLIVIDSVPPNQRGKDA